MRKFRYLTDMSPISVPRCTTQTTFPRNPAPTGTLPGAQVSRAARRAAKARAVPVVVASSRPRVSGTSTPTRHTEPDEHVKYHDYHAERTVAMAADDKSIYQALKAPLERVSVLW